MKPHPGGEFLVIGVPGPELDPGFRRAVEELQPGGFILFGRNIKSPEQLRRLTDDLSVFVRNAERLSLNLHKAANPSQKSKTCPEIVRPGPCPMRPATIGNPGYTAARNCHYLPPHALRCA